jgi:energy-coupling factor transporter ATP-binding protein EcfA2/GNAT superfamily N-acetyltransferase
MRAQFEVSAPVRRSARVRQMAGMFDVPLDEKAVNSWDVDLPVEEQPWNVGLVVGPSGSGKTRIAEHLWPDHIVREQDWAPDAALLDGFPAAMGIKDVVGLLTAVGLGSPPAWIRPYRTLSNGEAFRASMARALADTDGLVVVDEFTSVVDRQVAKVASHAVQKAVRQAGRQLVAVTCHYDVTDWLQPDWVFDVAAGSFTWRSVLPRPQLDLCVRPVGRDIWPVFRRHHYLSSNLGSAARCFAGYIDGEPVAFASYLHFPHPHTRNVKMAHRVVVLPDYQGLGISAALNDWVGQHLYEQGYRYHLTTAHPAMIAASRRSPRWRELATMTVLKNTSKTIPGRHAKPRYLSTRSFEYVPPAKEV